MKTATTRSFVEKVNIFLLASIFISNSSNNYLKYSLAFLYNFVVLQGFVKLTMCIFSMPIEGYFLYGIIITDFLSILQWWFVFLNKNKILRLSTLPIRKQPLYSKVCVIFTICIIIIFPFVFYIGHSMVLMTSKTTQNRCSFWVILRPNFKSITIFILHLLKYYERSTVLHVVSLMYFNFCIMILRSQLSTNRTVERKPLQAWKQCQKLVCIIEKLENAMSFLAFITIAKISIVIFTFVEVITEKEKNSFAHIGYCFQTLVFIVWFLAISFAADVLQQRCHKNLSLLFTNRDKLNVKWFSIDYFTYTEMIRKSSLTGWKIFPINRNLLLTYFASLVTYGLIIHQSKQ